MTTGEADRDGDHWISVDELYEYVHAQVQDVTPKQTPGKWVSDMRGGLYIAASRYSPDRRALEAPADAGELPAELRAASASAVAYVREGAVRDWDAWFAGTMPSSPKLRGRLFAS